MSAPKRPVATCTVSAAFSSNLMKSASPSAGDAALEKLGRKPLLVSAASVNCGTARSSPPMSFSERFILPCASAKIR